jgi:hypothetical protein
LITLTTLDDESDIKNSNRLLLTALGRARNTGTKYGLASERDKTTDRHASAVSLAPEHRVAVLELGEGPILTEPVKGKVAIKLQNPKKVQVFVLDDTGNRISEATSTLHSKTLEINLPGDYQSRFFEIIVEKKLINLYYWLFFALALGVVFLFVFRKKKTASSV